MTVTVRKRNMAEAHPSKKRSEPALKVKLEEATQPRDTTPTAAADPRRSLLHYQADVWQRSILFWDTLRQRADNMLDHERAAAIVRSDAGTKIEAGGSKMEIRG